MKAFILRIGKNNRKIGEKLILSNTGKDKANFGK